LNKKTSSRVILEAEYIIKHGATVRKTASVFGVGKSTVHKDMVKHLPLISTYFYEKVRKVLDTNLNERHIRGGNATKLKFQGIKKYDC
jgi:putative DeoR family transcriptional regulator (stage III sporulation protein D)